MDASQLPISNGPEISHNFNQRTDASAAEMLPVPSPSDTLNPPQEPQPKKPRATPKATPSADRPPGKSLLPLARVQKIMKADKELPACAKEAVFLISVATEEFIKRLGQAGQQQATREKRTTVQRRDVVAAVRRADEFVFLEEILSYSVAAQPVAPAKRKQKAAGAANETMNIKEAFGKSKTSVVTGADEEGGESDDGQGGISEARAAATLQGSAGSPEETSRSDGQGDEGDAMDVS